MQDASGFTALKKINEMTKIEFEYTRKRENNFETDILEDVVVLPGQMFEPENSEPPPPIRIDTRSAPRMGLSGGRFQIRR